MEKYTDSKVAICTRCGLKKVSDTGHDEDCFGICTTETKKIRSHEEIKNKLSEESDPDHQYSSEQYTHGIIDALKWVLGDVDL